MSNPSTRRLIWIIGGLLVAFAMLIVVMRVVRGDRADGTEVEVADAERRTLTQVVTASGQVQPEVDVAISPDVSGEIIYLGVREGQAVTQGETLVRIRPDFYTAQLEQARAGVLQARASEARSQADLLQAELELNRQRTLFERDAISQSAFDQAQTAYNVAKANADAAKFQVQSAAAREREAREQLTRTTITAPMSGTVSQLNVEVGERVVGTTQMTGTEIMRIALLDQMELEAEVNENDVVNVTVGDTAAVEVDAYPNRMFAGVVTEIANSARSNSAGGSEQVINFPVKVRLLDPHNVSQRVGGPALSDAERGSADESPQFRPGMSGTVDVFTESLENAIAIPIQAVTVRDFNQVRPDTTDAPAVSGEDLRRVVFVMRDGEAAMVEVETGISDETHIAVLSGLTEGDKVIIGPYRTVSRDLKDGEKVAIEEAD